MRTKIKAGLATFAVFVISFLVVALKLKTKENETLEIKADVAKKEANEAHIVIKQKEKADEIKNNNAVASESDIDERLRKYQRD